MNYYRVEALVLVSQQKQATTVGLAQKSCVNFIYILMPYFEYAYGATYVRTYMQTNSARMMTDDII